MHLTDQVKVILKRRKVGIAVIPGGLTSLLQPLDVVVSRLFKHHARQQWNDQDDWLISRDKGYNQAGKIKPPSKKKSCSGLLSHGASSPVIAFSEGLRSVASQI